jgi:uncharacterized protein YbcC (UPF0753/DUF2309 family)
MCARFHDNQTARLYTSYQQGIAHDVFLNFFLYANIKTYKKLQKKKIYKNDEHKRRTKQKMMNESIYILFKLSFQSQKIRKQIVLTYEKKKKALEKHDLL